MITEGTYLEMKKLIANYESEQLNKHAVISCVERPYLEVVTIETDRKYNPKYGDDRKCKCAANVKCMKCRRIGTTALSTCRN
jgi:hypothetical protein